MLPDISVDSFVFQRLVQSVNSATSDCNGANKSINGALSELAALCSKAVAFSQGVLSQVERQQNEAIRMRDKAAKEKAEYASRDSADDGEKPSYLKQAEEAEIIERHAQNAVWDLDRVIARLSNLCAELRQLNYKIQTDLDGLFRTCTHEAERLQQFSEVMGKTYSCIEKMADVGGAQTHIEAIGKIKPHSLTGPLQSRRPSAAQEVYSRQEEECVIIEAETQEEFFAIMNEQRGAMVIAFPAYSLHGLGGVAFLNAINAMGYVPIANSSGGIIDADGMIRVTIVR